MTMKDPQSLYVQLGRLLETMPDLNAAGKPSVETLQWLGRAAILVEASGHLVDSVAFNLAVENLKVPTFGANPADKIAIILFRTLARFEAISPPGVSGRFIPVGNHFDAFSAIGKVLQTAKQDILIVDPYLDEKVLTEFGLAVPEQVRLRLLTGEAEYKSSLRPATANWIAQYGAQRPLEVRLAAPKALHDRAIFIDGAVAWALTQSLNNFAGRSPAEIIRTDDMASMKIAAYEGVWANSQQL